MKKIFISVIAFIGLGFMFSGCGGIELSPEIQKSFDDNTKLYTTRNMHYSMTRRSAKIVDTTNYQVGILIPVNSEVTMDDINKRQIIFNYKGQKIILRNNARYTGVGIAEIAKQYFSKKKTDLSKFSKAERKAIRTAQVIKGMSKKAVLISLGTPPAHVTPSLEMDQWKYWRTRWGTFFINFENGKAINDTKSTSQNQQKHGFSLNIN
jgi:hypothetical protein